MTTPFLGRTVYDPMTRTYSFKDGTGVVPEEMRQEVLAACEDKNVMGGNGVPVLGTLFAWKDRLAKGRIE